jgi:hypothetical protein
VPQPQGCRPRAVVEMRRAVLPWLISISVYTLSFFLLTLAVEWTGRHFGWSVLEGRRSVRWTLAQSAVTGGAWGSLMTWLVSKRRG